MKAKPAKKVYVMGTKPPTDVVEVYPVPVPVPQRPLEVTKVYPVHPPQEAIEVVTIEVNFSVTVQTRRKRP